MTDAHDRTPIFKLIDFGLAREMKFGDPYRSNPLVYMKCLRILMLIEVRLKLTPLIYAGSYSGAIANVESRVTISQYVFLFVLFKTSSG